MPEQYLYLTTVEKANRVSGIVEALYPYGVMIANAVQTGSLQYTNSAEVKFDTEGVPDPNQLGISSSDVRDNPIVWGQVLEWGSINRYREVIRADVNHRLVEIRSERLPADFTQTLAVAGNDVKEYLISVALDFSANQMEQYDREYSGAIPLQRNFLGSVIEGVVSVEQALSVMWQIGLNNGTMSSATGIDDLLLLTIKYATGSRGFVQNFASSFPFTSLVSTVQRRYAPAYLVTLKEGAAVKFISIPNNTSYHMFRKEDAKHYWDKHFPCPAVFVPTAEVIAKSNQAWPVPGGDLATANSDVTIMDWTTLVICRQIAYRENRPKLADRLLQEFLLRMAKLREVNMLGLPLHLK